jgi:hypothetical protein
MLSKEELAKVSSDINNIVNNLEMDDIMSAIAFVLVSQTSYISDKDRFASNIEAVKNNVNILVDVGRDFVLENWK